MAFFTFYCMEMCNLLLLAQRIHGVSFTHTVGDCETVTSVYTYKMQTLLLFFIVEPNTHRTVHIDKH